jgi:hypothetical protein
MISGGSKANDIHVETSTSLPEPSTEHDMTTTARLDPDILVDGGLPKELTELTVPANPSLPEAAPAPSSSQINFNGCRARTILQE